MPPVRGIIAPSSAKHSAPEKHSRPPITQTSRKSFGDPRTAAMSAGAANIPDPIIPPTMIVVAATRPRSRASSVSS